MILAALKPNDKVTAWDRWANSLAGPNMVPALNFGRVVRLGAVRVLVRWERATRDRWMHPGDLNPSFWNEADEPYPVPPIVNPNTEA